MTEQSKSTQTRLGELSHAGALSETQAYPSDDKISLLIKKPSFPNNITCSDVY